MSHLGRPDGKVIAKYSLAPVAEETSRLLTERKNREIKVKFLNDCVGPEVEAEVRAGTGGQVFLLENLRFHIEEEGSVKDENGNKIKASSEDVKKFREG